MEELIEALHVIKDECKKHDDCCDCPMFVRRYSTLNESCIFDYVAPLDMDIDKVRKELL